MKTMNRIFTYGIILIVGMGIIACSGSDGTDGINGIDGAVGLQGPAGEDGDANVITSNWLDVDWNITDDPTNKVMRIPITEISQDILRDNTLVMVYLRQWGTSSIYTLPSAGRWSNTWYSFTFGDNSLNYDGIIITLKSTDGVALTEYQATAFRGNKVRFILIPANTASSKSSIDYSNYNEVVKYYSLSY